MATEEELDEIITTNLRLIRKFRRLEIGQVAETLGIKRENLSRCENKHFRLTAGRAAFLAKLYKVSLNNLTSPILNPNRPRTPPPKRVLDLYSLIDQMGDEQVDIMINMAEQICRRIK